MVIKSGQFTLSGKITKGERARNSKMDGEYYFVVCLGREKKHE